MIITDLRELKSELQIHPLDTSEDKTLAFFVEAASNVIEEFLDRPGLTFASRTEYYSGTGSQRLPLRSRPVATSPTILVYVDQSGAWGTASGAFDSSTTALTYGSDFGLQVDQPDGTSRSGILLRFHDFWTRPQIRQAGWLSPFIGAGNGNIKVVYSGGYTVDNLPAAFRFAANMLVGKMRYIAPVGMEISSDSYEGKNFGFVAERRDYWMSLIKPLLFTYKNWTF